MVNDSEMEVYRSSPSCVEDEDDKDDFLYDVILCYQWEKQSKQGMDNNYELKDTRSLFTSLFFQSPFRPTESTCWRLSCSSKGEHVAVAEESHLNIWHQTHEVVSARVAIPTDSQPEYRQLLWSPDNELIVLTSSRGRVFAFDNKGQPLYALLSNHIEDTHDHSDSHAKAYVHAAFKTSLKSNRWNGELVLITYSGTVLSFRLSVDGYQESFYAQLPLESPTVTSAISLMHSNLWVTSCLSNSKKGVELQCWRRTDEEPFVRAVELVGGRLPAAATTNTLSKSWPSFLFNRRTNDPALHMEATKDEQMLLTSHQSGTLAFWQLPSLALLKTVALADQPCFDDLSPNLLLKPHLDKTSRDPNRFLATQVRWWDESKTEIVVIRGTGALTLLQINLNSDDDDSGTEDVSNVLGESAEFFAPGVVLSAKTDDGIFVLENETVIEKDENDESDNDDDDHKSKTGQDEKEETGWLSFFSPFSGRAHEQGSREGIMFGEHRLYYLRSTSPSELFSRKIDDEEYGEAILLAHHYNLDTDLVYFEQWKRSKKDSNAIQDYLSKMSDTVAVLVQCLTIVSHTLEDNEALLRFGLRKVESLSFDSTIRLDQCRGLLEQYMTRLETYVAILEDRRWGDRQRSFFDLAFYRDFRSKSLITSVLTLAEEGDVRALEVCLDLHWSELKSDYLTILDHLPESLSVDTYRTLIPSVNSQCVLSHEDMSRWFEQRARRIVERCNITDNALKLIDVADETFVSIDKTLRFLLNVLNSLQVSLDTNEEQDLRVSKWSLKEVMKSDHLTLMQAFFEGTTSEKSMRQRFHSLVVPYFGHLRGLHNNDKECVSALEMLVSELFFPFSLEHTLIVIDLVVKESAFEPLLTNNAPFVSKLVLDVLMKCDKNAEISSLRHLLDMAKMLLSKSFFDNEDLSKTINTLGLSIEALETLRQVDVTVSLGMLHKAKQEEALAKAIVDKVVDKAMIESTQSPLVLESTLSDLLSLVKSSLQPSLSVSKAFYITLNKLLTSDDSKLVNRTLDTLSALMSSKPSRSELQSLLSSFEIDLSASSLSTVMASASLHYVHIAKSLSDTSKLSLAQNCLSLMKNETEVMSMQCLLEAIEVAKKLEDVDLEPAMLATTKSSKDIVNVAEQIINTCSKRKSSWSGLILQLAQKLALRLNIDEKAYLGSILVKMTKKALNLNLRQEALDNCLLIVEKHIPFGFTCCLETVKKFEVGQEKKRRLIDFCCTYCQPHQLRECLIMQRETSRGESEHYMKAQKHKDLPLLIIERLGDSSKTEDDVLEVFSEAYRHLSYDCVEYSPKKIIGDVLTSDKSELQELRRRLESLIESRDREKEEIENKATENRSVLQRRDGEMSHEVTVDEESVEDEKLVENTSDEGWDVDEVEFEEDHEAISNSTTTADPSSVTANSASRDTNDGLGSSTTQEMEEKREGQSLMSVPEALRNAFSKLHSKLN